MTNTILILISLGAVLILAACYRGNKMATDYVLDFDGANEKKLIAALMAGDTNAIKAAVNDGANLNAVGRYESTPLAVAIKVGTKETLEVLLSLGADPNFITSKGVASVEDALTLQKDPKVLEILLDHGLNPSLKSQGTALIFFTITQGEWPKYELLLQKGADINAVNTDGSSVIFRLVRVFEYHRAKDLLQRGADATTRNIHGTSVVDQLVEAQYRFCEDTNLPDCRMRAELLMLLRDRGQEIPPGIPGVTYSKH